MLKRIFYLILVCSVFLFLCVPVFGAGVTEASPSDGGLSLFQYLDDSRNTISTGGYFYNWQLSSDGANTGPFPIYDATLTLDQTGCYLVFGVPADMVSSITSMVFAAVRTGGSLTPYFIYPELSDWVAFFDFAYYLFPLADTYVSGSTIVGLSGTGTLESLYINIASPLSYQLFQSKIDNYESFSNGFTEGLDSAPIFSGNPFSGASVRMKLTKTDGSFEIFGTSYPTAFNPSADPYLTSDGISYNALLAYLDSDFVPSNYQKIELLLDVPNSVSITSFQVFASNNYILLNEGSNAIGVSLYTDGFVGVNNGYWNTPPSNLITPSSISVGESGSYYTYTNATYSKTVSIAFDPAKVGLVASGNDYTDIPGFLSFGKFNYSQAFDQGFNSGYISGSEDGFQSGFFEGEQAGYSEGLSVASQGDFFSLISSLIDAPIQAFQGLLDFEFLGINVAGFALSCLTLVVVLKIVMVFV